LLEFEVGGSVVFLVGQIIKKGFRTKRNYSLWLPQGDGVISAPLRAIVDVLVSQDPAVQVLSVNRVISSLRSYKNYEGYHLSVAELFP
jgi:hypothetical protein